MTIARFEGSGEDVVPTETKMMKQGPGDEARKISNAIQPFALVTEDGQPLANNKEYFPDLGSLGKHYLVSSMTNPHIKRHYTTCCAMNPVIYDALVKTLNGRAGEARQSL